jgi:hypothetical protein
MMIIIITITLLNDDYRSYHIPAQGRLSGLFTVAALNIEPRKLLHQQSSLC